MERNVEGFWSWVEQRMEEVRIPSMRELEARSGFQNGAIGRRKNQGKFPTVEMAEGMCRALRVDWVTLWRHAGYVSEQDEDVRQRIVEQFDLLDEDDQALALAFLERLVGGAGSADVTPPETAS